MPTPIPVDVLTVLAPGDTICDEALAALQDQGFVALRHFVVPGPRRDGEGRVAAIARARNAARALGEAPYALFLDRDVVLPPRAVEQLVLTLARNPGYGAVGVCYQSEPKERPARHVAMGATLFRRPVLARLRFRWAPGRCECACACADLRRMGWGIDYHPTLRATHRKWTGKPAPGALHSG